jgi:hypothetical protein
MPRQPHSVDAASKHAAHTGKHGRALRVPVPVTVQIS